MDPSAEQDACHDCHTAPVRELTIMHQSVQDKGFPAAYKRLRSSGFSLYNRLFFCSSGA